MPDIRCAMPSEPDPAATSEAISVEVHVTLADQIAFNEHLRAQPGIRARRARLLTFSIIVVPLVAFAAGIVIAHLMGDARASLWAILGAMPGGAWRDAAMTWLACAGFLAALTAGLELIRRPLLRRRLRMVLLQRPGIDPADPELREWARCTFDAEGYSTQGRSTFTQIDWSIIRGLDETPDLLLVRTGQLAGFILPKREVPDERIDDIRRIVRRMAGPRPPA